MIIKSILSLAAKKPKSEYTVHEEDGYVKVKHPKHGTICAAIKGADGRLRDFGFMDNKFLHNSIRQPAMDALTKAGYK